MTGVCRIVKMAFKAGLLLTLLAVWVTVVHAQGPDSTPAALPDQVGLYARMEWTIPLDLPYENPFDSDEIDVFGVFTAPNGQQLTQPAFWMQPMTQTCVEDCAIEVLEPSGSPEWHLRFTPNQPGLWSYVFQVRFDGETATLDAGQFEVIPTNGAGFIRVAENGRYFEFEHSRDAFFPIGHNLAWSWEGGGGVFAYQRWLHDLAENGGNYARLYVDTPWFIGLEWASPPGDYTAAQEAAWRLDTILETAADLGIYLDVVVLWHQALANEPTAPVSIPTLPPRATTHADWDQNPYNVRNGGPLTSTLEFFSNAEARTLFQRRLRYLVARWGYSVNIFAWDLLSDADRVLGYSPEIVLPWLAEMAAYLRQIDPYDHLVTAGTRDLAPAVIAAPGLDFGQVRLYARRPLEEASDQVAAVWQRIQEGLRLAARPVLLTEFSLNPWYEPADDDPTGIHIRQTVWSSALSGAAGAGASWWWDTYLDPDNLTAIYGPLARFLAGVPWNRVQLTSVQARLVAADTSGYRPLRLDGFDRRFNTTPSPDIGAVLLSSDGPFPDESALSSYLFGSANESIRRPHSYLVTAPVDTRLTVGLRGVSPQAGARLVITLDGVSVVEIELQPGARPMEVEVPLPAGEHIIGLENRGTDWLQIEHVTIGQYIAPLRVVALANREYGILLAWFQHRDETWQQAAAGITPTPVVLLKR
jgi:hypothetical protein